MGFIMGLSSYNIHVVANEYYVGLAWRYQPAEMSYNNWWQKKDGCTILTIVKQPPMFQKSQHDA